MKAKQDLHKNLLYKSLFNSNSHTRGCIVNLGGLGRWVRQRHYFASHIQPRSRTFPSSGISQSVCQWVSFVILCVRVPLNEADICCGDASSCEVQELRSLRARPKSRIVQYTLHLPYIPLKLDDQSLRSVATEASTGLDDRPSAMMCGFELTTLKLGSGRLEIR